MSKKRDERTLHERIDELRARAKELADKKRLTDNQEDELNQLRHAIAAHDVPRPPCCPAARLYPAVTFLLDHYESGDTDLVRGRWLASLHDGLMREESLFRGTLEYLTERPEAKFCPYCGTAVPEMRRVSPSTPVCRVTDGGYYCDTCKERLSSCTCLPPEAAWEPVPK
jgi:hypothetical protein